MRHLLSIHDLTREDALYLLHEAARLKRERREQPGRQRSLLQGRTLAMIFEKPSLRTRVSFEVGMVHLGGHAIYLAPGDIGLGQRESIEDVARVLGGMCDGVMARVFEHRTVRELAAHAGVPVINGLCDIEHPCQALADFLTIHELLGLKRRTLAYVGDGNNVCHSLMLLGALLGLPMRVATPPGYAPPAQWVEAARTHGEIQVFEDPAEAVEGADVVYTDVWTSMGQEAESERRLQTFPPFQVNAKLMERARPNAIVLHCLPAHRGEEIDAATFERHANAIFAQAHNRLHAQKAVLTWLMA